jgi:hypothetical protein
MIFVAIDGLIDLPGHCPSLGRSSLVFVVYSKVLLYHILDDALSHAHIIDISRTINMFTDP